MAFLLVLIETFSRVHEVLSALAGGRVYVFTPSVLVALGAVFLSGRVATAWKTVPGQLLIGLTIWMVLGFPFSMYKGGTLEMLRTTWAVTLIVFMLTASMISNMQQMRRVIYALVFSTLFVVAIFPRFGGLTRDNRMIYPEIGTLANPNELAMHLLFGLPFLFYAFRDKRNIIFRMVMTIASLFILYIVFKTGSRGALIGLSAFVIGLFFYSSRGGKLRILVGASILAIALFTFAGDKIKERFSSSFADDEVTGDPTVESAASAAQRKDLLLESIRQTFLHPVFGVGADNFPVAYAKVTEAQGRRKRYAESHNAYTQISSETGIPGGLMYFALVFWCFRHSRRLFRWARASGNGDIERMALYIFLSLLMYCVVSFFGTSGYRYYLPVFAGLTLSLMRIAGQSLSHPAMAQAAPAGYVRRS